MNLRGDSFPQDLSRAIFARRCAERRQSSCRGFAPVASGLVAVAMIASSGCKTGSMGSPLAWWPGASKGSADNEKLASAPSFDGKVEKPSETQNPYPTTTTPQSYALDGTKPPALASAPPASQPPAAGNSPVTYGLTPPPPLSTPTAPPTASAPGSVAAQVGPYQGWPAGGSPPAGGSSAAAAAAPGGYAAAAVPPASSPAVPPATSSSVANSSPPGSPPAGSSAALGFGSASSMTPPSAVEPPDRYADARFSNASATAPASNFSPGASSPAVPPATTPEPAAAVGTAPASRYATGGPSQFGQFGSEPVAVSTPPAASATPVPPAAVPAPPAADIPDPSAFSSPSGTNRLRAPSAAAGSTTPPARRPDPGYRPGGTSTYRPSQAIVDDPSDDRPVRQASFDSPLR